MGKGRLESEMGQTMQTYNNGEQNEENVEDAWEEGEYEEDEEDDSDLFPTHAAFTIPVAIRPTPKYGGNQFGVFAVEDIPPSTKFWEWTDLVEEVHSSRIYRHIIENYDLSDKEGIRMFLRRGFVLPSPYDDFFYSNPDDAACFMNHSSTPNCVRPQGTSRLIRAGEELTMDYSGNGNPQWYVDVCHQFGILTAVEIAEQEKERGGNVLPAFYSGPQKHGLIDNLDSFVSK